MSPDVMVKRSHSLIVKCVIQLLEIFNDFFNNKKFYVSCTFASLFAEPGYVSHALTAQCSFSRRSTSVVFSVS